MLQDKIQKFQQETLREKTFKNLSKMLFNLQLIKISKMNVFLGIYEPATTYKESYGLSKMKCMVGIH